VFKTESLRVLCVVQWQLHLQRVGVLMFCNVWVCLCLYPLCPNIADAWQQLSFCNTTRDGWVSCVLFSTSLNPGLGMLTLHKLLMLLLLHYAALHCQRRCCICSPAAPTCEQSGSQDLNRQPQLSCYL